MALSEHVKHHLQFLLDEDHPDKSLGEKVRIQDEARTILILDELPHVNMWDKEIAEWTEYPDTHSHYLEKFKIR